CTGSSRPRLGGMAILIGNLLAALPWALSVYWHSPREYLPLVSMTGVMNICGGQMWVLTLHALHLPIMFPLAFAETPKTPGYSFGGTLTPCIWWPALLLPQLSESNRPQGRCVGHLLIFHQ